MRPVGGEQKRSWDAVRVVGGGGSDVPHDHPARAPGYWQGSGTVHYLFSGHSTIRRVGPGDPQDDMGSLLYPNKV